MMKDYKALKRYTEQQLRAHNGRVGPLASILHPPLSPAPTGEMPAAARRMFPLRARRIALI